MGNRDLDLTKYEGKTVSIKLQHIIDGKQHHTFELDDLHFSGWMSQVTKTEYPKTPIEKTIKEMFFVQHNNGGRRYGWKAKSYKDYFNDEVKEKVMAKRAGGIFGALSMGDVESADIMVYFTDGTSLDSMQFIDCPEEWYSEQYSDKGEEMLERGFYETAEEAIEAQKPSDDIFGTRYFPVVAFPIGTPQDKIDHIVWRPKATSQPLKTKTHIIYGTRCKQYEYKEFITESYELGGKVLKGTNWDWEG